MQNLESIALNPWLNDHGRSERNRTDRQLQEGLLDSWKEIATFLGREVRTVQLWEKREGLPIHRHFHVTRASVHAYRSELAAWQESRRMLWQNPVDIPPTLLTS